MQIPDFTKVAMASDTSSSRGEDLQPPLCCHLQICSDLDKDFIELERLIDEEPDLIKNHVLGISVGSEALYRKDADLQDMLMNFFSGTYTCMDYVAWIDACVGKRWQWINSGFPIPVGVSSRVLAARLEVMKAI
jgi:hypothetical protein